MTFAVDYASQLRSRGFRITSQRMAILHVLDHSVRHLSPAEVYEKALTESPQLTEPTVYRTLEFLAANGLVRPSNLGNGHLAYEIARHEHHHLVCRNCGNTIELEHALLRTVYRKLESSSGYKLTDGHVTFLGLCPDCQQASISSGEK